jgi:HSF-type DNA-binding
MPTASASSPYSTQRVTFPEKLFRLLEGAEAQGLSHVISWQPHGRCFLVRDREAFSQLLPTLMPGLTKWKSFQKQLHLWGFTRLTSGPDFDGYFHEYFLRYRPHLLNCIQRTVGKREEGQGDEPNFEIMPFVMPLAPIEATRRDEPQEPESSIEETTHLPAVATHPAEDPLRSGLTAAQDSELDVGGSEAPHTASLRELDTNYGRGKRQRSDDEKPIARSHESFPLDSIVMPSSSPARRQFLSAAETDDTREGTSFGISYDSSEPSHAAAAAESIDTRAHAHLHRSSAPVNDVPGSTSARAGGEQVSEISTSQRSTDAMAPSDWDLEPRPLPPVIVLQRGVRRPLQISIPVAQHPSFVETGEQEFEYIGTRAGDHT